MTAAVEGKPTCPRREPPDGRPARRRRPRPAVHRAARPCQRRRADPARRRRRRRRRATRRSPRSGTRDRRQDQRRLRRLSRRRPRKRLLRLQPTRRARREADDRRARGREIRLGSVRDGKPLIRAVAELYAARAVRAAQDPYEAWLADARAAVKRTLPATAGRPPSPPSGPPATSEAQM